MKYGLIVFKNTKNIGDDIQTYAAIQYLPKIDYYIERESMDTFVPDKKEIVTTIMNGWFLHDDFAWPPSPFINPLFVSSHFTNRLQPEIVPRYLDETGLEFLKKHEPIGLRDNLMKDFFDKNKIKNYYSGCLTLTIKKFKNIKQVDQICLVDVSADIINKVLDSTDKKVKVITHELNDKINSRISWDERISNVEDLLKTYQASSLVITSRLHCALPCLALGTPVILIYDEENDDVKNRLKEYLVLLTHTSEKEFLSKKGEKLLKEVNKNKDLFIKYKEKLEKTCIDFIENSNDKNKLKIDNKEYKEYYASKKTRLINYYQKDLLHFKSETQKLNQHMEYLELKNKEYQSENEFIKKNIDEQKPYKEELDKLKLENQVLDEENKYMQERVEPLKLENENLRGQLDRILYSRAYKVYKKVRNLLKKVGI